MLWLATTILVLAPQGDLKSRDLTLPLRSKPQQKQDEGPVRDALQQRFAAAVRDLRRSLHLAKSKEQAILMRLAVDFDAVPERAVKLAHQATPDLMHGVMRVLATSGGPAQAKEIRFLLLTRKFGRATRIAVETMYSLAGDSGKQYLFDCLVATNSSLRKHSSELLRTLIGAEDAQRLIDIAEQNPRVKPKALSLLGVVPSDLARRYLVESLSAKPLHAEQACRGLIVQGEVAVPYLQAILIKAARGRAFAYAAFALTSIGEITGQQVFVEEMRAHLLAELDMPDAFVNSAVAIALASMAWDSDIANGQHFQDAMIVDRLVRVIAPIDYIAHLAMLQPCAQRQITRFTGKDYDRQKNLWRNWISQLDRSAFVGNRRRLELDQADADEAVLTWQDRNQILRFRGPNAGDLETLEHSQDYVLSGDEILELLTRLTEAGFMAAGMPANSLLDTRNLQLSVGDASCRTEPAADPLVLNRISATMRRYANGQRWQIYRNPAVDSDPVEFWRLEQQWVADHPDDQTRNRRLKQQILALLPTLAGARYDLAVQHLAALPNLGSLCLAADGAAFLSALGARHELDEIAFQLMELALLVPGNELWPQLLHLAEQRFEAGGRQAMARIFALLGPDRILEALRTGTKLVRLSVMDELAQLRDARAIPDLLTLVDSEDVDLRLSAVFLLGRLQAPTARQPLLDLLAAGGEELEPALRRTAWVSLGRIGGDQVLPVLQDASRYTDAADRQALIRALGAFDHPSAARELARMYARWGHDNYGQLAMTSLRMKGDLVASPFLEDLLTNGNQRIRRQLVVLLAEFQNPVALSELFTMLAESPQNLQEVTLIAGITGQNVAEHNNRMAFLRAWYRANFNLPQSAWFLNALDENGIAHALDLEQLRGTGDLSALPELARLLVEAPLPHLRSLAARILRIITQEDYGTVSIHTDEARRRAIAERYLYLIDEVEEKK